MASLFAAHSSSKLKIEAADSTTETVSQKTADTCRKDETHKTQQVIQGASKVLQGLILIAFSQSVKVVKTPRRTEASPDVQTQQAEESEVNKRLDLHSSSRFAPLRVMQG